MMPLISPATDIHRLGLARISVQRLRMLQQKKEAQAKMSRRDIATLIERGKLETARVKVETSTYATIPAESGSDLRQSSMRIFTSSFSSCWNYTANCYWLVSGYWRPSIPPHL